MTCREAAPLLALLVGDDLTETAALAAHVERCAECSATLAELRESQALLRLLKEAEPSLEDVAEVRRRVLSRVGDHRAWGWWGSAAAVAAVAAFWWLGPIVRPPQPRPVVSVALPSPEQLRTIEPTALTPLPQRQTRVTQSVMRRRPGIRAATLVRRGDADPEIHLQTENPKVLIVLVPEGEE